MLLLQAIKHVRHLLFEESHQAVFGCEVDVLSMRSELDFSDRKGSHGLERQRVHFPLIPSDMQQPHVLGLGLPFNQARGDSRARLQDSELILCRVVKAIHAGTNHTCVFVTPHHDVHAARQLGLADVPLLHACRPAAHPTLVSVLVYRHDVEPLGGVLLRARYLDILSLKAPRKPLVTHVTEPVQCDLGHALRDEDGREHDLLNVADASKVVHQIGRREKIEWGKAAVSGWVVMVSVNRKDRELYVIVGILVVDRAVLVVEVSVWIAHHFEVHCAVTEAVIAHHLKRPLHGAARRLVVVEDVPSEKY
mmetsp:Transcript_21473/g.46181  ORF Transcript_21473/g.46181 Transcript_21473/m.46181 type:complete len:307 (+) Transcript_21473:733-1653(+)